LDESTSDSTLTLREKEILSLAARGHAPKRIAETLGITKRTVDFHLQCAIVKLGAANRTNAVALAFSRGIIALDI
jgi:DNA-binding CsgD family transcriptional regulator